MVTDEIRRRRHAVAARRLADDADLHLVLGAPHVQQQDIKNQDGVRRDHTACQTGKRGENRAKPARISQLTGSRVSTRTCADAAVGQVRGDGDPPALVDTHSLEAAVHPGDESAQAHLADEGFASVMAVDRGEGNEKKKEKMSFSGQTVHELIEIKLNQY